MSRTFFSLDRKGRARPWLPAPVHCARRWVLFFCPVVLPQVLRGSISVASSVSSDNADSVWEAGKPGWLPGWQHIDLSEARGLVLFRVVREGIGITRRLECPDGTSRLQALRILTLEPERLKNRSTTTTEKESPEMERALTRDAQAACDFSFSASKFSPFFHSVKAMAAILRASVRRAMVGLMPLASERW